MQVRLHIFCFLFFVFPDGDFFQSVFEINMTEMFDVETKIVIKSGLLAQQGC